MQLGIRAKLVLLSLLILVVVSFAFTQLQISLSRALVEEDLRERAVTFAREIAATIGDRREFESSAILGRQIERILRVRQNVLQLDVLAWDGDATKIVAASHPRNRLPFTRREAGRVLKGDVVSRLIAEERGRYWEVMAPVTLDGVVAGAVAAKFSLERADALAAQTRRHAFGLTAVSVLVMGLLMSGAVALIVNRPIRRFMDTIRRVQEGDTTATVAVMTTDELGVLARHFNEMIGRIRHFNDELRARIKEATHELEGRYREVERLRELLFAMQRSLSHAERLALSGRIMAEVAHEVGTPLHSVAGHLELLRLELPAALTSDTVRRRLTIIENQLARVTEIIAQLLDLTRRAPGEPVALDLGRLVRDTVELVRPGVTAAALTLHVTLEDALPPVRGHSGQLQQVVLNLLTNAIDATPAGGRITVATRTAATDVELEVADTGPGIPLAQQKQIFEPFFSTKGPGHGTGLGLFISAQIVAEHRGRIDLTTEEGQGTTFRVRLPVAA